MLAGNCGHAKRDCSTADFTDFFLSSCSLSHHLRVLWRMWTVEQTYPSSTATSPSTSSKPSTPPSLAPAPTPQPCRILGRSLPAQMALSSGPQKDNYCTCSVLAQPSYEFIQKNNRNLEAKAWKHHEKESFRTASVLILCFVHYHQEVLLTHVAYNPTATYLHCLYSHSHLLWDRFKLLSKQTEKQP